MNKLILPFEKLTSADVGLAGGKGASLGEMTQASIPVPPGFVILSNTFEMFLEETDLNVEIEAVLDSVNHKEMHTVENASEKIEALILGAEISKDITDEIQKSFKKLTTKYVAVRSSATAEDSASAAWAGQLESYLNTTEETLLENVKKCWASLFTPRAIFYRFEKDLHKQQISVAVVVQKMVESEKSGIAFSVHPVTQDKNQLIIEAGLGLGEAIVSGQITPNSYVVEKQPQQIIDKNVQTQTKGLYRAEKGGNEWSDIPKEKGGEQVLSDEEILELSNLILRIEKHYGFPCDIEWATENGKFYIVQSRPITTLRKDGGGDSLNLKQLTEHLHYKIPTLPYFYSPVMQASRCKWKNDYIIGEWFIRCNLSGDADLVVGSEQFSFYGDRFLELLLNDEETATDYLFNLGKKVISTADFLEDLNYENLKHGKKISLEDFYDKYAEVFSEAVGFGYSLDYSLDQYIKSKNISMGQNTRYSSFMKREQADLAKIALLQENLKTKALEDHSMKFSWLLNNYTGEHRTNSEYFDKRLNDVSQVTALGITEIQKPVNLIEWVEFLTFIRDERKRANLIAIGLMERCIPKICSDFKVNREQVVMHTVEEINKGHSLKYISERYIKITHSGIIDETKDVWEEEFQKIKVKGTFSEIKGIVANKGKVTGVAKIVINREDFKKVKDGDVIVSSMTRPEFAPILSLCGAIVTNEGGITCHAAIISRELNKPCIIGTKIATQVLKDGDMIEVDANNGIVRILK